MTSLRLRLLLNLASLFTLAWLGVAVAISLSTRHQVGELFDANLAQSARVLQALVTATLEKNSEPHIDVLTGMESGQPHEHNLAFQVWRGSHLLLHSRSAPSYPMALHEGFSNQLIQNDEWRVFVLSSSPLGLTVQVGERCRVREELIRGVAGNLLDPLLLVLPLLVLVIPWAVNRGLSPLHRLARELANRSPHQLHPVPDARLPGELKPLISAFNTLLGQLERAFLRERHFTGDAAHELRTPLASLKIQVQLAQRARGEMERQLTLQRVNQGVDRATHLVDQLLTLTRLEPEPSRLVLQPRALEPLCQEVLAVLAPAALAKGVELTLEARANPVIPVVPGALEVLVRNLVDNAVRHTPEGGRVEVTLESDGGTHQLVVDDSGPGIAPPLREEMFQRFRRGAGDAGVGCGLGLSIVARVCALHQARVTLEDSPLGGVRARVVFPSGRPAGPALPEPPPGKPARRGGE